MDIPNSGAIFTLGKSHLAENTQSYFYIKNDPIKRLVSGPNQSAVICESGRLFVWGENHYGQLGIGGHNNTNQSSNNNNNNSTDIVTKPTCVKSLKTLGLKVADVAFGNEWAILLTQSNELFYTGRSIFDAGTNVARNFTEATIADETCHIIPFGRLIGWGSNGNYQLGIDHKDPLLQPHEIKLDAPVQQFICGPDSTLVLTENGSLYLTGRLNEFVFTQFTELQKNLSATEQIIFMHISQTNEIYIVTNAGSIYRSLEAVRNKSLIFQRFYDYDSEEHGPIWKLLKGFSFYTVLTKAHKFYTTFSESGHHLKTFREISKFKNLRLLDMAVGEQHILVHGIPRSSTLTATMGPAGAHRYMSGTHVIAANERNASSSINNINENNSINNNNNNININNNNTGGNRSGRKEQMRDITLDEAKGAAENDNGNEMDDTVERQETPKPNTPVRGNVMNGTNEEKIVKHDDRMTEAKNEATKLVTEVAERNGKTAEFAREDKELPVTGESNNEISPKSHEKKEASRNTLMNNETAIAKAKFVPRREPSASSQSPTESMKSRKSVRSIKFDPTALEKNTTSNKMLRPRTPYPESSTGSTPQTIKRTPLRNYSYEAAMEQEFLENTSPLPLLESLENIPENLAGESAPITAVVSSPTPPYEEDEQLTVEINSTVDELDPTVVVNEIRFINNGVDVTANVKQTTQDTEEDSSADSLDDAADDARHEAEEILDKFEQEIDQKTHEVIAIKDDVKEQAKGATEEVADAVETRMNQAGNAIQRTAIGARDSMQKAAVDARDAVQKVAADAGDTVHKATAGAKDAVQKATSDAGDAVQKAAVGARDAVQKVTTGASDAIQKATTGARDTVEAIGGNAKHMASDASHAVENVGSNAAKAAGGAKNAVENALFKMADGTKYAVDTVATKISNEMQDAKDSLSSLLHGKSGKRRSVGDDDNLSSGGTSKDGGGPKTNTTTNGEDDERTTASVNSAHTSAGNPFEHVNPFESSDLFENELNELDDTIERGKKTIRNEVQASERYIGHEVQHGKGKVQQFFSDMRTKGLSCRNEKAIRIDDEPPIYTVEGAARRNSLSNQNQNHNTSKVCTIL